MRHPPALLALLVLALAGCGEPADPAAAPSGPVSAFRFAERPEAVEHAIPLDAVRNGIGRPDPRDAIPAILDPVFVPARGADHLPDDARVLVVEIARDARAYPLAYLDRHELVNDHVGGMPILVSWCPLCGSGVVYERAVGERILTFGVSGYLYKSDVLMYDHETESFWSQLQRAAVVGPLTGTTLTVLPSRVTSLGAFRRERAAGRVLGTGPGMLPPQAYRTSPYAGYADSPRLMFPVGPLRRDLPAKAEVIGLAHGGEACAVPLGVLRAAPEGRLRVEVGGRAYELAHDAVHDAVTVRREDGTPAVGTRLYWFAWQAFHPGTRVHPGAGGR